MDNYEKIKIEAETFYKTIGAIKCPALEFAPIHFTAEGFNHLLYKGSRNERKEEDRVIRFRLLSLAKQVIVISSTYQEYDERLVWVRKKKFKKVVNESVVVKYWGFVAIIDNRRVKVVVRQIGNGQKHFFSVIPAWKTQYYRDIKVVSLAVSDLPNE